MSWYPFLLLFVLFSSPSSCRSVLHSWEAALAGLVSERRKEFVARHRAANSIQFQWRRRRLLGLRLLQMPASRECPRFSLETAYYNPLYPLRLLPAKVSAFFWFERRDDRSTTWFLAPRKKERKKEKEIWGNEKRHILRFYFRFEHLSTFPFCVHDGTRVEAAPFIRETSPANQPPFQLEIETRSFEIPLVFRGSSTSSFFSFLLRYERAHAIERG